MKQQLNKYLRAILITMIIITNAFFNINFAIGAGTQTSSLPKGASLTKYANVVPNSTQVLGSDLLSGWNFTSGWSITNGTITGATTYTCTTADCYIYKTSANLTVGTRYKITIAGTSGAGNTTVREEGGVTQHIVKFGAGSFNTSFNYTAQTTRFNIYNNGGNGTTMSITSLAIQPITTEGGSLLFDTNALNKTISDKSGRRTITNTATTVTNLTSTPSGGNHIINANGSTSALAMGADFLGTTDLTIAGWIYATGWGETSSDGKILSNTQAIFKINDTNDTLNFSSDGSTFAVAATSALSLNNWYFVAVTRTGNYNSFVNFYKGTRNVAPALSGTANQQSGTPAAGSTVYLLSNNGATTFAGQISDLKAYNKILTTTEITNLWSANVEAPLQTNSLDKGLIANFPLNRATMQSATIFKDTTPYARTGTSANAITLTADQKGLSRGAMTFNGTTDLINTGSNWLTPGNYTFSQWIYVAGAGESATVGGAIIRNGSLLITYRSTDGTIRFDVDGGITGTSGAITTGAWHYLVVTLTSAGVGNCYIDGVISGSVNQATGSWGAGSENVTIGNDVTGVRTFNGNISNVRVYNRVLTATEVKNLYKSYAPVVQTNSLDKGLIAAFPLNRSTMQSATTFKDTTPNAYTGTISAGASAGLSTDQKGLSGGAYDFDGLNTVVSTSLTSNTPFTRGFTIGMWVYAKTKTGGGKDSNANFITKSNEGTPTEGFFIGWTGAASQHFILAGTGTSKNIALDINLNEWVYIVATVNSANLISGYKNGTYSTGGTLAGFLASLTNSAPVKIGSNFDLTRTFNGYISDVRIWNRVLTPAEVMNLYKSTK